MALFRAYLVVVMLGLYGYTLWVGVHEGWNLLPVFFGNIAELSWQGQFNLDFITYLALSAIWVAWRHGFTAAGNALAVFAFFGGMMFLAPYLLWAGIQARGDARVLLLGEQRAAG